VKDIVDNREAKGEEADPGEPEPSDAKDVTPQMRTIRVHSQFGYDIE